MTELFYKRTKCRLCHSKEFDLVLPLTPTPVGMDYVKSDRLNEVQEVYDLDLYLCRNCGHAQILDVVSAETIFKDYPYLSSSSLGLPEHFQKYAEEVIEKIQPEPGSLVVDIGCNDSTLLNAMHSKGMRALGIEPVPEIARKASVGGVEVLPEYFTVELANKIKNERSAASIITANNLFADIDDLDELTQGIHDLLAPDGVLVIEFGYIVDLIERMIFDYIYHEHRSYFGVTPLSAFFNRYEMELIDVEPQATKGGSLRCTAQLAGGPRPVSPSVGKFVELEEKLGVTKPEIYKEFVQRIDALKNELVTLLKDLKAQGKTIAGYGASVTVSTLIYHFGIAEFLEFIVDDNPIMQGRFSPGYHIPVFPSDALYEKKPDYVVVLAWRFAEPIMSKHPDYLKQGGHFIIPVPKVEVK